ncbi:E3 binding domain-containing protein [Deinococcus actinosclerus]|uniref:Peripheral subunit-binding (PSBD) domain-containing protein n=1 Tax=Deinococcus actinosclerus TaxID=1768108 RepID=A0ABN4JZU0_9DEIO|nr:E3 binding domain-containing protein [Deinococcus actinosclerus]ALW87499.1 hypothetical protein AUC44_00135 [Deinococcus actinosclerus]
MDRIAPLAKILAEANGIDWQKLQGSGAGGQIIEQDILNYLSRVMSGEEDPPDTPVDLPPPDWNGEEVPTADMLGRAGMSADMLSRAGVDTDLTAFVEQTRAAPQVPATPASSLDDDALEFELEDEPETPAPVAATPAPEPVAPAVQAPEPVAAAHHVAPETPAVVQAAASMTPPAAPAAPTPPAAGGGLASGLGSLLSRLYQKPAESTPAQHEPVSSAPAAPAAPTPAVPAAMESAPVTPAPVAAAPAVSEPATPDAPAWTDGRRADDAAWNQPAESTPAAAETHDAPAEVADVAAAPVLAPEVSEPAAAQHVTEVAAPTAVLPEVSEPAMAPVAPAPVDTAAADTAPVGTEPATEAPAAPETDQPTESLPAAVTPAATPAAEPAPQAAPAAAMPSNGVWFGAYLRRDADVAALHDLRGQVTAALSRDLPLALLIARAAQRHAETLGLGSVAMHAEGGARAAGSGSLRDALDAGAFDGTPDLLVVDAGALDLDDLHFPHTTTLSVGRVQDGRAALTLNGDVDAGRAAQFLAQVVGTLEQPILLVL